MKARSDLTRTPEAGIKTYQSEIVDVIGRLDWPAEAGLEVSIAIAPHCLLEPAGQDELCAAGERVAAGSAILRVATAAELLGDDRAQRRQQDIDGAYRRYRGPASRGDGRWASSYSATTLIGSRRSRGWRQTCAWRAPPLARVRL